MALLALLSIRPMTDLEVAGTDRALDAVRRFGRDGAPAGGPPGAGQASPGQASDLLDAIREVS